MVAVHRWTEEQKEFLRVHYPNNSRKKLLELLNKKFSLNVRETQLKACLMKNGIKSGRTGHFNKGHIPFNKGKKGLFTGGIETRFRKGSIPHNYKPVGSERVERDGYILIKVSDEGAWNERWRMKHRIVWEEEYGEIPKGQCLIFLDGNKQNVDLNNLRMISREDLVRMNQNDLISDKPEITEAGIIIAGIHTAIGKRTKK